MDIFGLDYRNGMPVRIETRYGRIVGRYPWQTGESKGLPFVAPGLVDLQVNGYMGVDFNSPPVRPENVRHLMMELWKQGVTSFFPTVITNSDRLISNALKDIAAVLHADPDVRGTVPGIHLEGPFISAEDGPRGAHKKTYVRPPAWEMFLRWQEAAEGNIQIITLSPEWPEAVSFIEQCVKTGVRVSIGHTAATPEQIRDAASAGATMSTHLGNGCHLTLPRHSNYIWEQLASENLWSSIISDGFHLPDAVLKVFLKAKPHKTFLVSDTTSFGGLAPGIYAGHIGGEVELSREGRLCMRKTPVILAGSAQSLLWCVNLLVIKGILPLKDAWNLGSLKPIEFLNQASVEPFQTGDIADLVLFTKDGGGIKVLQTIKSAELVSISST
jgi:N-acetylglucosamine-6-phosphate deacetylase